MQMDAFVNIQDTFAAKIPENVQFIQQIMGPIRL